MIDETILALLEGGEPTGGDWTLTVTENGRVGVEIPGGHSLYYDLEGACPECLANMRLIAASKKLLAACETFRDTLEQLSRLAVVKEKGTVTLLPYHAAKLSRLVNEGLESVDAALKEARVG